MRITSVLAILLALASLALLGLTFSNLLSGDLEARTCQTACVQTYYFAATGLGILSVLLAFTAIFRSGLTTGSFLTLIFSGFPVAVVAGIFAIGTMVH